ncbi:hypothetical protein [Anaplasma bovis]|uniref:hypothetical protein n=1 Tax=Anaplasma bovis TaxID=186733 RepID=UPI002FF3EF5B
MFEVKEVIDSLDKAIEKEICKSSNAGGAYKDHHTGDGEKEGKCGKAVTGRSSSATASGLTALWDKTSSTAAGGQYDKTETPMGLETSKTIANDIRQNLNREQKGKVSSAFAKAHEGAEIVEIRSISTTDQEEYA